jgi:hypothetical protein
LAVSVTKVGTEFLVNTQTAVYQLDPTITGLRNGGFVVTWNDESGTLGDSSGSSIKAKVFDAAGGLIKDEFLVNTHIADDQKYPTITGLQNGGFVVTWVDDSGTLGDPRGSSIKAKVFDAAGALVTDEFLVNTETVGNQSNPTITGLQTGLQNGGFVVTWETPDDTVVDDGSIIKAKVFNAAGALVTDEFLVNTQTAGSQFKPTVTGLQNGGFVVTWNDTSATLGDSSGTSIKAKVFAAAGALVADEFLVNTQTASNQYNPTVTGLQNGGFVVSWQDDSRTLGDNSDYSIKAKVFDAAGVPVTDEFLVNTQTANSQYAPTITGLRNGGFVVTWYDTSGTLGDSSGYSIKAKVFDAAGALVTDEFLVNTETGSNQYDPTTTGLQNGGFVVTWNDSSGVLGDDSGNSINAQIFNVNSPPVVTASASTTAASEQVAIFIDNALTVTDDDSTTLSTAAVSITGNFHSGEDVLAFANTNASTYGNIQATYNSGTGVLSLASSGATATVTQWEAALRAVTYTDKSDSPNTAARTISYVVNDGIDNSIASIHQVTVTAVNDAPVSIGHNYTLSVDGPLTVAAAQGLLNGASDPENDPLSALVATGPEHGTLSLNADGSFVYKAANTFFGEDSFSFKANDGALDSNISTVKINVARETASETTTNPNGGSTTTYYDAKDDQPWASQSHNFDSNGRETSATVSYDDGSLQGATFDANNDQPWKSQSSVTNAQGQVTNMGVIYDDGTQQIAIFDADDNQPWLSQNVVLDDQGRQTTLGVIYDDGSQQTAIFDAANNQLWSSQNMVYDVHGHLTNVGVIYDDLHTETAVYDVHFDHPWTSQSAVYDASGKLIAASVSYDDGHVENWHI